MKNILKLSFVALITLVAVSCKKDYSQVSKVVTPSYPNINFPNGKFFSIKVGDPTPQIVANAYDSLLKQAMGVTYDPSVIDNTTPGLYVVPVISEKNVNGYFSADAAYVAVTNIDTAVSLNGSWDRQGFTTFQTLTEVKNGLYQIVNIGGAAGAVGYLCQKDSSSFSFPVQPTIYGDMYFTQTSLRMISSRRDTMRYVVINAGFGTALRTFVKR
jgi:hypothetical protein